MKLQIATNKYPSCHPSILNMNEKLWWLQNLKKYKRSIQSIFGFCFGLKKFNSRKTLVDINCLFQANKHNINFKLLLFVFKRLNNLAPPYLSDLLQPYCPSRSLRSADQLLLTVPKTRLKLRGDRAFAAAAPKLWNDLPLNVRQASSLS